MFRREFMLLLAGSAAGAQGRDGREMVSRSVRPVDLEMPLSGFSDYITPTASFFVRSHVAVPAVDVSNWRLRVEGSVAAPLTLSMEDLRRLPPVELVSVLECAGNGRRFYEPAVPGIQWGHGAVGNGRWRGVRLRDVLRRAGVHESAREVLFEGADVPIGTMPDFRRSITVGKALDSDTLLAYEMNGEALTPAHGFPLRVVAPGWAGDSWIKWVTAIRVLDRSDDGFWMARAYRHPGRPIVPGTVVAPERMQPLTSLRVKSVIASPDDGAVVRPGSPVTIRGVAWSGDGAPVERVDVSLDGGRLWRPAMLRPDQRTRFGWRQWAYTWTPMAETFATVLARAHDAAGQTQPLDQEWNPSGYAWNVVPRVHLQVAGDLPAGTGAPVEATPAVTAGEPEPAGFRSTCLVCHDDDLIRQQRLGRADWDREMTKMNGWGARVREEERSLLLDYLARRYGPRRPDGGR